MKRQEPYEEEKTSGLLLSLFIALTSNAMEGDRKKCLACGMNDYLTKPLQRAELEMVLRRWIPPTSQTEIPQLPETTPTTKTSQHHTPLPAFSQT